ncbi:hypothetical protein I7I50_05384 [Histoplasma capsulatum G186AR]|uniref:Uncharacterized protein n=1 Tax=Ajellomyces capsulatus TaxID=5037 RepID=A0A8H7ZC83_AJECA|nr:hypothetical protein I7I52_03645 [Histoplasma capsulatum]QSS76060.1 hypothetical protein I7I50_05384 [Histoplasma capsulatum G186AR]
MCESMPLGFSALLVFTVFSSLRYLPSVIFQNPMRVQRYIFRCRLGHWRGNFLIRMQPQETKPQLYRSNRLGKNPSH